jgi:heterodisulfide reductase subunit C2
MVASDIVEKINQMSGQQVQLCFHCHKCTAGCPTASEMEFGPDRVLRMLQFGEISKLMSINDIWLCSTCETCGSRCPNDINVARVMAALRELANIQNAPVADPDSIKFHRVFLKVIQEMGRMHEASLLGVYKIWSLHLFDDLDTGIKMILKGKIPIFPHVIKGRAEVKQLFETIKKEGQQ